MFDMDDLLQSMDKEVDILPPNATELEKAVARFTARFEKLPVITSSLLDAQLCPSEFLPWLAWAYSVDSWQDNWQEELKRNLIEKSIREHKRKGTRAAIRHAIRKVLALADKSDWQKLDDITQYDNSFQINEWWEVQEEDFIHKQGKREPHTFDVKLLIGKGVLGGRGILGRELYQNLRNAIDVVKPISTRYSISIGGARFESIYPVETGVRTVKYMRFLVTPKPALQFSMDVDMSHKLRIASWCRYTTSPLQK